MIQLLSVENVSKNFGGVSAADMVNMQVYSGEVHGLIGPNGAGKSTILNLISGIYSIDQGKIILNGQDVTKVPPHTRAKMGLGRTFQTPRFLQRSSIKENLNVAVDMANKTSYLRSFFGAKGYKLESELNELLDIVGFTFNWDDDISALTYGQLKLLEIVRSLLTHPILMLVDEPAAGLNNSEEERVLDLLNFASKKRNIGVLLIEHSMDLIMSICSNITVINFGKVICEGCPADVSCNEAVIEAYLGRRKNA